MQLEEIAVRILLNSGKFAVYEKALEGLRSEFKAHFPSHDYQQWNLDLPEPLAHNIISNVGKNGSVSVRFIIKDLEIICKAIEQ